MARFSSAQILTGVIVIAGLAVGSAIDRRAPSAEDVLNEPFIHTASLGQVVSLRTADIQVTSWKPASTVVSYGSLYSSVGLWVVIDLEILAKGRQQVLSGMELVTTGGKTYGGSADIPVNCDPAQAGIPQYCQVAFEVLPEDIPGMRLHIPAAGIAGAPGDDLAVIDLEIPQNDPLLATPVNQIDLVRTRYGGDL